MANLQTRPAPQDLEHAFGVFNALSERLTSAYGRLEARVADLTHELVGCGQRVKGFRDFFHVFPPGR